MLFSHSYSRMSFPNIGFATMFKYKQSFGKFNKFLVLPNVILREGLMTFDSYRELKITYLGRGKIFKI